MMSTTQERLNAPEGPRFRLRLFVRVQALLLEVEEPVEERE